MLNKIERFRANLEYISFILFFVCACVFLHMYVYFSTNIFGLQFVWLCVQIFGFPCPTFPTIIYELNTEYDPNPLQSLGKRNKQRTTNAQHDEQPPTSASGFSFQYNTVSQLQLDEEETYKYVAFLIENAFFQT